MAIVIVRFAFRELRERKIKLSRLFIVPVVFGLIAAFVIASAVLGAPHALGALVVGLVAASVAGGVAGLGSAHFTTLRLAPEPGFVYTRGSYATLAIWVGALALRVLVRFIGVHDLADELIANAATITLLAVAVTVVRYRVLVEARLAAARGITTDLSAI